MSSVAGWMSKEPIALTKLRDCFYNMQKELPRDLHFGEVGSQFTILFEPDTKLALETIRQNIDDESLLVVLDYIRFAERFFIQLRVQYPLAKDFNNVFDKLGLEEISTKLLLAEQTTADIENDVEVEPGFGISENIAFAACGGISSLFQNTTYKSEVLLKSSKEIIDQGECSVLANWFNDILGKEQGKDRYEVLLNKTPTYLFSILFDNTQNDLRMVGLRQNESWDHTQSPYDHLYYIKDNALAMVARTELGTKVLSEGISGNNPILVKDRQPVSFSLKDL